MHNYETVIVVDSLVPGGLVQLDGIIKPGDKLLAVNGCSLQKTDISTAIRMLKSAPPGKIQLDIAKPLFIDYMHSDFDSIKVSS